MRTRKHGKPTPISLADCPSATPDELDDLNLALRLMDASVLRGDYLNGGRETAQLAGNRVFVVERFNAEASR